MALASMPRMFVAAAALAAAGCATDPYVAEHPVNNGMPPLKADVFTATQVDVRPVATRQVEPDFPYELGSILTGQAVVAFTVQADGKVTDRSIVSADDVRFGDAAYKAIGKWQFHPATLKGTPVPCRITALFFFESPYGYVREEGQPAEIPSGAPPKGSNATSVILR